MMELTEQIYVNVEELRATCSNKQRGSEKTETKLEGRDAVAREETKTRRSFKASTVCLGVLCFLLLSTVAVVGIMYNRDVIQLSRDLSNQTAERHELLVRNHNLTDEKHQLQSDLMKALATCPAGWMKFGCRCYLLSTTRRTWSDSRQQCQHEGADLVIITSLSKMMFLGQLGTNLKFWIGLSRSSSQTRWTWIDGTSLRISYWQNEHSYYKNQQNCAAFNSFPIRYQRRIRPWSSEPCSNILHWVCEKEAFS